MKNLQKSSTQPQHFLHRGHAIMMKSLPWNRRAFRSTVPFLRTPPKLHVGWRYIFHMCLPPSEESGARLTLQKDSLQKSGDHRRALSLEPLHRASPGPGSRGAWLSLVLSLPGACRCSGNKSVFRARSHQRTPAGVHVPW